MVDTMDMEVLDHEGGLWCGRAGISDPEKHEDEPGSMGGVWFIAHSLKKNIQRWIPFKIIS